MDPSPPQARSSRHPVALAFGWLLSLLGGLWLLLTGGCTLSFIGQQAASLGHSNQDAWILMGVFLLIGAVCVAPGAALLIVGLVLLRRSRRSD